MSVAERLAAAELLRGSWRRRSRGPRPRSRWHRWPSRARGSAVTAARSRPSRVAADAPVSDQRDPQGPSDRVPGGVEAGGGEVVGVQVDPDDTPDPRGGQVDDLGGGTDPRDPQVRVRTRPLVSVDRLDVEAHRRAGRRGAPRARGCGGAAAPAAAAAPGWRRRAARRPVSGTETVRYQLPAFAAGEGQAWVAARARRRCPAHPNQDRASDQERRHCGLGESRPSRGGVGCRRGRRPPYTTG